MKVSAAALGCMRGFTEAAAMTLLIAASSGCDGCEGAKPYAPFSLDDGGRATVVPSSSAPRQDASAAMPSVDAGAIDAAVDAGFTRIEGKAAEGNGRSWAIEGGSAIKAPTGRTFEVGLVLDADGDGKNDLLAWARAADGLRGELWFASGARPEMGQTVAALPPNIAGRECSPSASLAWVGPRSVALSLSAGCPAAERGKPSAWVALVRLGEGAGAVPELRLEMSIATPPPSEKLAVAIDATDRDADGRDDVTATVTLSGALLPFEADKSPLSATIRFFDRPAGLSRDPSEPVATLRALADRLLADARKKATAKNVASGAVALRRLRLALCEEDGASLVTTSAGPVRCGENRTPEIATAAEALAALSLGEPALALDRALALELVAPKGSPLQKEVEKLLAKTLSKVTVNARYRSRTAPVGAPPSEVAWGPLAFEHAGHLLIRTEDGVVRVDGSTFEESVTEISPWPLEVATSATGVLRAVRQSCDGLTPSAEVAPLGDDPLSAPSNVALPLLLWVSEDGFPAARCEPSKSVRVTPLSAADGAIAVAIGGRVIRLTRGPDAIVAAPSPFPAGLDRPIGSMRSPDGASVALRTPRGLLVQTGARAQLIAGSDLDRASLCVPSNGGKRVACVVGPTAVLYEAP